MWTLIGRSAMNIFQKEDSQFFFMKVFVKYTNPIIKLFKFITPSFIKLKNKIDTSILVFNEKNTNISINPFC